mgnify:CR=1 FL=1
MTRKTTYRTNFVYPQITESHYTFGVGKAPAKILREDGDWRDFVPPDEDQNRHGVESAACFVEANQRGIATTQEEEYGIIDQNYSARFNLMFAEATPYGGDPLKAAQSIRDHGMIPDSMLPFSDDIASWEEFNSYKGGSQKACEAAGRLWRERWDPRYGIVYRREMLPIEKYAALRQALKSGPVPMSVYAWEECDGGYYEKPAGVSDNHLTLCVYLDADNRPYWRDTYSPYLKVGTPFYNSDFAMQWTLEKLPEKPKKVSFLEMFIEIIKALFKRK